MSSALDTSFLNNVSPDYLASLYQSYLKNPSSIEAGWAEFFTKLGDDETLLLAEMGGASWTPANQEIEFSSALSEDKPKTKQLAEKGQISTAEMRAAAMDSVRALMLIRAYRARGHLEAKLDPLGLEKREEHPELDPLSYGFSEADLNRPIFIDGVLGLETASMNEIVAICRETYASSIGVEYNHIQHPDQKSWLQRRMEEPRNHTDFTPEGKKAILERLTQAEGLEQFLQKKYTGTKRFGLEGGEAVIPAMEQILKRGGQLGVEEVVLGMAHRGRLNVLTNVMHKPFSTLFAEFQGKSAQPDSVQGSGDVKYHLGASADREFDGNMIHLSLTANPSHLEAADPVVVGKVRAKQDQRQDGERKKVMGLLLHGDAAMAGQGVVGETFHLSQLSGYTTGGTLHIVINNQIGFTTTPSYARSSPYCTDIAKAVQAPIFHVNGDDPEAVVHVARMATEFRQEFGKDVVIDVVCYRRHGHNEGDEPLFTQPLMYTKIKQQETTRVLYAQQLVKEGTISADAAQKVYDDFDAHLEGEFKKAETFKPSKADMLDGAWDGFELSGTGAQRGTTGVKFKELKRIGEVITSVPDGFNLNSKIARQFKAKMEAISKKEGEIDWATAEALAFGTLLDEGYAVRLSGQDVGRGTFSQRHAALHDQKTGEVYFPLQHIKEAQGKCEIINSPLSEFAVLGFDYGYSLAEPNALTLWEGQFGDFVNGAQVMIDQFITSGESKWLRMSGIVMLLPHGYEGQGPEHSSARPERFLQQCAEDNIQVANVTTPANYFHILRRQIHRKFRKPLIMMTPKSLLRHKLCVSPMAHLDDKTTFHRVLDERHVQLKAPSKIKRVVLCTGKVYYDLYQEREERGIDDITFIRLEQLYPFPHDVLVKETLKQFPNADIVWCQEEPMNMGYWTFVDRRIEAVLTELNHKAGRPKYIGRPAAASPATGLLKRHNAEQAKLIDEALTVK